MLRITVLNEHEVTRFKLEGKLVHEWVAEAEQAWSALEKPSSQETVIVDLCGVSFVDDRGRDLLLQMQSDGAKFVGSGPLIGSIIEEIAGCKGSAAGIEKWARGLIGLLFMFLLANGFLQTPLKKTTLLVGIAQGSLQHD